MSDQLKSDTKSLILVVLAGFLYALALTTFINVGGLFPGGFSGISLLIVRACAKYFNIQLSFGLIYILFNIGPTILVYKYIGKRFTIFSIVNYMLTSLLSGVLPVFHIVDDILLIAIFGGLFVGLSTLLALKANASGGGTDFIAIFMANRYHKAMWNYIFVGNAIVLTIAGAMFGWEKALYSIIFQFVSTQVVNTMHQRYKLVTLTIITEKPDDICNAILAKSQHSLTKLWGEGAFSKKPKCMLYMVLNAFEVQEIVNIINAVDPQVFINLSQSQKIIGNFTQRPYE
ncbi:MAG: YitT family protein [Erysipelotrichaceae bacterium]|nr:YitT family protein [Erysipelotrichaceae bacterium]